MLSEVLFMFTAITFLVFFWGFLFFIFDDSILNGYFKKKLQKRFPVEE